MNLLQFREFFATQSGRYDLVNPDTFADDGIDRYIQHAQKYLDHRVEIRQMLGQETYTLNASTVSLLVDFSEVHDVYLLDASESKQVRLQRLELHEARLLYNKSADFEGLEADTPLYYVIGNTRSVNSVPVQDIRRKLLFLPPSSTQEEILIEGVIMHKELREDGDENFWTNEYPITLSLAVQLILEKVQRNSAGVNDLAAALEDELIALDMETVGENQHKQDYRSNSWKYVNEQPIPYRASQSTTG
jgi:hypothetical protein